MSGNEMEALAQASFYVTDAVKGLLGDWTVVEEGWGEGDLPRALREFSDCLRALKAAGFVDKPKITARAPYTHNIRVGCFYKRFPDGRRRWITLVLGERFGFDARFTAHDQEPWKI